VAYQIGKMSPGVLTYLLHVGNLKFKAKGEKATMMRQQRR
jgi:hypothetical protein